MVQFLFIAAVFVIAFSIFAPILGIMPFTWIGLVISLIFAVLFVALANILMNQEEILFKLDQHDEKQKRLLTAEKKVCSRCNHSYDLDYKSCPKCGNAQE